jgi:hypothetical protein
MPRRAGRRQPLKGALLLLVLALATPAFAQAPVSGAKPPVPGQPVLPGQPGSQGQPPVPGEPPPAPVLPPAPTPVPAPVPVIPEVQPIGPPSTVPSAPQRVLPPPTVGLPVTATFQFEPSVTLREEYSDNFNLTERNRQSNFRSVVAPELRLGINSPLTKGLISYTFSPSHDTLTDEVLLFHSLLGQVVWQANPRWILTLADAFTRSDQPGEADRLGLRQERRTFASNTFSLTSDYLIGTVATRQSYRFVTFSDDDGAKTTTHSLAANASVPLYQTNLLSVGYDYLTTDSSAGSGTGSRQLQFNATSEDFSVQGHQLTAAASRQVSPLTAVGLKTTYALRNVTTDTDDTDFQLWTATVFTKYVLPGRLTLDGSLGVSGLTTGSEDIGPGFFTATSLSYEFARAVVSLAVDRGFSETFAEGQNFGVIETEGVLGSLTYRFTPSLTGIASGFYRRNKGTGIGNNGTGTGSDGDQNEETKNWGGSMALSWRLLRNLLLDLSYSYVEHVAKDNGNAGSGNAARSGDNGGYTENRVQAALRFSF